MTSTAWRAAGLLLVAALFFAHEAAAATVPVPVAGTELLVLAAAPSGSTTAPATQPEPGQRLSELPASARNQGSEDDREVGWVLIAAAVVLAIVIVVFVVRHRRTGRPG